MTTKTIVRNEDGTPTGIIVFEFDDKTTEQFDLSKVNDSTKLNALMHGFSQKIGDSYAGAAKSENPLAYAKEAVKDTIAQLYAGDWRAAREGGGPRITDLAVALSRLTGKTAEESQAFVDTLDDDQKKAWKAKGKVKATLAVIAAEKAAERAKKLAAKAAGAEESENTEEEEVSF